MNFAQLDPADGDPIPTRTIDDVLTAGDFVFDDGATQTFRPDGTTTYVESGRPTEGEWYVEEDGRFCSSWPSAYTGCYNLKWLVEDGETTCVRFVEIDTGREFTGRYFGKRPEASADIFQHLRPVSILCDKADDDPCICSAQEAKRMAQLVMEPAAQFRVKPEAWLGPSSMTGRERHDSVDSRTRR